MIWVIAGINKLVLPVFFLMAAINIQTQIPSQIVTLEQLAAWSILTLTKMFPDSSILETSDRRELQVQVGIFRNAEETDQLLMRLGLIFKDDYVSSTAKLWMNVKEIGTGNIPAAYTNN